MTLDIVAFIRARLDEDEQMALAATPGPWHVVHTDDGLAMSLIAVGTVEGPESDNAPTWVAATLLQTGNPIVASSGQRWIEDAAHIARHDPARMLRGVEAKRRMLDEIFEYEAIIDGEWGCSCSAAVIAAGGCGFPSLDGIKALRIMVSEFADHPDYRQEWTP